MGLPLILVVGLPLILMVVPIHNHVIRIEEEVLPFMELHILLEVHDLEVAYYHSLDSIHILPKVGIYLLVELILIDFYFFNLHNSF